MFSESSKGRLIEILEEYSDINIQFDSTKIYREEPSELPFFSKEIAKQFKELKGNDPRLKNIKLLFEPGRYMTSLSTSIIFQVLSKKSDNSIVVDAGTNLVGDFRFSTDFYPILNLTNPSFELKKYTIFGNCPEKEDILVLLHQGSYTFSGAWRFIKSGAPYIIIDKDNNLKLIKKQETFEDRYSGCEF